MTTLAEFKRFPRITIRTTSGWQSGVSCNSPARVTKAEIIYTSFTPSTTVRVSARKSS